MTRTLGLPIAAVLVLAYIAVGTAGVSGVQQSAGATPAAATSQQALLRKYCESCHNQRLKTANLMLDTLDVANVSAHPEVWEKVVRKLRAGLMPPSGLPRPDKPTQDGLSSWLEAELDRAAAARPEPGRTEDFHRLNRAEYQLVIRDLLGLEALEIASLLPTDDASYGFDNIAGVLKVSPTLMERYLAAARKISRLAVGVPVLFPDEYIYQVPVDLPQGTHQDGLPFGTRGGARVPYHFPVDGEYQFHARLMRQGEGGAGEVIPTFPDTYEVEVSVDGKRVGLFTLAGEEKAQGGRGRGGAGDREARRTLDDNWKVRVPVEAGLHDVTVAFLRKSSAVDESVRLPFVRRGQEQQNFQPSLSSVTISGPLASTGSGDTASRRRIFVCRPATVTDEAGCAKRILSSLARRAYRRPVSEADVALLLPFFEEGRSEGDFDAGIQLALERLLVSPNFLFRVERDPASVAPNTPYRISDLELASRLSFFIWSSIPDDELLDAAVAGELSKTETLEKQVRRMLADRRSQALVENFGGQWLYLRNLANAAPDLSTFPDFDESLRKAFRRETELFFESIVREDRGVLELLTADYTFLNERLARHYGIPNVKGSHFRRVAVADEARRGLLGQGSLLTVTSYPHRTSAVVRGKWILENLLGTPPPEPPPNVPALRDTNHEGKVLSMRARMAQHRSNAVCSSCHTMMDPPGLSLERFDAIGRRRTVDETFEAIDASGVLPDGTKFDDVTGLRQALLRFPDRVVSTTTEKLLTYALGRGLEYYDAPTVRRIVADAAPDNYKFSSLILGVVRSIPFQMRSPQRRPQGEEAVAVVRDPAPR
jgi:hypothetical protein